MQLIILTKKNDIELNREPLSDEPTRENIERITKELASYNHRQEKLAFMKVIETPIVKSLITN